MNILIVDDDASVLETVDRFLSARGHRIRSEANGVEAMRRLVEEIPDVVISDIQMPGMDGIDFLKAIRERFPDLPVVMMTGSGTLETAIAALRQRATDYLTKPIQLEELQACIDRVAAREENCGENSGTG